MDYFRCSLIYWINRQHISHIDKEINKFSCSISKKLISQENLNNCIIDNLEFNNDNFLTQFIIGDLIRNILNFWGDFCLS